MCKRQDCQNPKSQYESFNLILEYFGHDRPIPRHPANQTGLAKFCWLQHPHLRAERWQLDASGYIRSVHAKFIAWDVCYITYIYMCVLVYLYLRIYSFVHSFIYLFFIYLFTYLFIIYLSIYLPTYLPIYLSIPKQTIVYGRHVMYSIRNIILYHTHRSMYHYVALSRSWPSGAQPLAPARPTSEHLRGKTLSGGFNLRKYCQLMSIGIIILGLNRLNIFDLFWNHQPARNICKNPGHTLLLPITLNLPWVGDWWLRTMLVGGWQNRTIPHPIGREPWDFRMGSLRTSGPW